MATPDDRFFMADENRTALSDSLNSFHLTALSASRTPQSKCRNQRVRPSFLKAIQSISAAKISNAPHAVKPTGVPLSNTDKLLHCLSLLISPAEIAIATSFAHQF